MNRAFMVFSGLPQDGCLLVFAENRNAAKSISVGSDFEWSYIEMNTRREPDYDQYSDRNTAYRVDSNDGLPKNAPLFFADELRET